MYSRELIARNMHSVTLDSIKCHYERKFYLVKELSLMIRIKALKELFLFRSTQRTKPLSHRKIQNELMTCDLELIVFLLL